MLTGTQSELTVYYNPPIVLNGNYECALLNFETFYSVHNVDDSYISIGTKSYFIPGGSYEVEDLSKTINNAISRDGHYISIVANSITHRTELKCTDTITLTKNIANVLGFTTPELRGNRLHISDKSIDILPLSVVQVELNVANGSYINDIQSHTIHTFFPSVAPGYRINEIPHTLIYHPVNNSTIDRLVVRIIDQKGNLIDFSKEIITVRVHFRKIQE